MKKGTLEMLYDEAMIDERSIVLMTVFSAFTFDMGVIIRAT